MTEREREQRFKWIADILIWIFALSLVFMAGRILWTLAAWIGRHVRIV